MSDFKAKMHQIRFRLGLPPRPRGSLQCCSPRPSSCDALLLRGRREGRGREGREGERGEAKGEKREGMHSPTSSILLWLLLIHVSIQRRFEGSEVFSKPSKVFPFTRRFLNVPLISVRFTYLITADLTVADLILSVMLKSFCYAMSIQRSDIDIAALNKGFLPKGWTL